MTMTEKKVQLVFGEEEKVATRGAGSRTIGAFAASIDQIADWFKQFQIDSIELWISGGAETGEVLKLFVSAKGEGGMRVVLKPKGA
jgi:hypothetical protein